MVALLSQLSKRPGMAAIFSPHSSPRALAHPRREKTAFSLPSASAPSSSSPPPPPPPPPPPRPTHPPTFSTPPSLKKARAGSALSNLQARRVVGGLDGWRERASSSSSSSPSEGGRVVERGHRASGPREGGKEICKEMGGWMRGGMEKVMSRLVGGWVGGCVPVQRTTQRARFPLPLPPPPPSYLSDTQRALEWRGDVLLCVGRRELFGWVGGWVGGWVVCRRWYDTSMGR